MLQESWEKQHTVHGIPYYVNHNLKKTQWDHPYLLKIMHDIGDYNYIQFAAYRTAGKLFYIQKELRLNTIAISTLQEMFERHGYSNTSHVTNIGCRQLYAVLYDIYMHGRCNQTQHISCETLAELTTNYVLNMYDVSRGGTVKVSSVKTGLAILCDGKLIDKYRYIFDALSDVTCCINRNTLHDFLFDVTQIPDYIQESVAFGGVDVHAAVNSCLKQSGHSEKSVNIDMFLQWLFREPQTIVWLTTLHRMTKAKNVKHDITCAVCKVHPVIGLRYKCLQCFHYNICQECFFGAKQSKSHKSTHPMQEYCSTSSTKDETKAFVKTIMNKLSRKHRKNTKLSYLPITKPVQKGDDTTDYFDSFDSTSFGTERYLATPYKDTDTYINMQPIHNNQFELKVKKEQEALENILKQIEEENRGLIGELSALHQCEYGSKDKCKLTHRKLALQKHSTELDRHIEKLKSIIQQSDYKSIQAATESITHITKGSKPEGVSTLDIDIPAAVHTRGESMLMTDNEQRTCGNEQVVIQHENSMYTEELDGNVADVNNETAYSHQDPSVCTLLDELSTMDIEQSTDCTLTDVTYSEMYSQEKQQIQRLIEKLQQTYNSDTSILSCTGDMNHTMDEMVNAANQIAEAMTDFVGNKHSVLDDPSLLDLADELGLGVDTDESVL